MMLLAEIVIDGPAAAVTVLGGIAGLITQHFIFRKYIRQAVGIKETSQTEIAGQPITVKSADDFVKRPDFHKHAEINRAEHARIDARVAALERKLEDDKIDIIKAGEDRAKSIHDRINVVIEKVGELRGEVNARNRKL